MGSTTWASVFTPTRKRPIAVVADSQCRFASIAHGKTTQLAACYPLTLFSFQSLFLGQFGGSLVLARLTCPIALPTA
jgi:hypothetical protein